MCLAVGPVSGSFPFSGVDGVASCKGPFLEEEEEEEAKNNIKIERKMTNDLNARFPRKNSESIYTQV